MGMRIMFSCLRSANGQALQLVHASLHARREAQQGELLCSRNISSSLHARLFVEPPRHAQ